MLHLPNEIFWGEHCFRVAEVATHSHVRLHNPCTMNIMKTDNSLLILTDALISGLTRYSGHSPMHGLVSLKTPD